MSSLLGLSAYSDDEDDTAAATVPNGVPVATIEGLVAYADDSEDELMDETTTVQPEAHGATRQLPPPARIPATVVVAPPTAPLRPSASLHSIGSSKPAPHDSSLSAPSSASAPRSASSNDVVSLGCSVATPSFSVAPSAAELATLPPVPSTPLAPALAARHQSNLARQTAQAANPRALPLVQSLLANKSFHNPYILQRIAQQLDIRQYGSNIPNEFWTEQNLEADEEEDDYLAIQKQAETAVRSTRETTGADGRLQTTCDAHSSFSLMPMSPPCAAVRPLLDSPLARASNSCPPPLRLPLPPPPRPPPACPRSIRTAR
jgi:hypothetical protein